MNVKSVKVCAVNCQNIKLMLVVVLINLAGLVNIATAASVCNTASITATTPTSDFIDNGDGTLTHRKTGLMWKQCPEGYTTTTTLCDTYSPPSSIVQSWNIALSLAEQSTFANYTDWRLPNIKELMTLVERQCHSPAINQEIFPSEVGTYYWTSTPSGGNTAWMVDFATGFDAKNSTVNLTGNIRLVRGGM